MPKTRTVLTIDDHVLRAVRVRAARTGKDDSEVIEEALRRDLGLDLVDRLWARNDMGEDEAVELAIKAQHAARLGQRSLSSSLNTGFQSSWTAPSPTPTPGDLGLAPPLAVIDAELCITPWS